VRCRIVTILEDGTLQVVPEHPVTVTTVSGANGCDACAPRPGRRWR
jgi:hypothetical protein